MESLLCFLSIYLYINNMVLNEHIHMGEMVDYVLDVSHFLLVCRQFHCLVFLSMLLLNVYY